MQNSLGAEAAISLPKWVPKAVIHYLAHTERGCTIRELARKQSCHPSTILRQVRRFEQRRDDPLIDDALTALSKAAQRNPTDCTKDTKDMTIVHWKGGISPSGGLSQERVEQEAKRILLRLSEPGAILAVAREMETAVVVREAPDGGQLRTAVVDREIAQAIALKDWISCHNTSGRVARYFITNAGRTALRRLAAQGENAALGFGDSHAKMMKDADWDIVTFESATRDRAAAAPKIESPLVGLSRRREKDGKPFLPRDLVAAGERLREDFELAKMGRDIPRNLADFLVTEPLKDGPKGAAAGHLRVQDAMKGIGAGLADVAFHCCCLLEGLELTEKEMGWSARSGKIVLRIALQRLKRHYDEQGKFAPLIG